MLAPGTAAVQSETFTSPWFHAFLTLEPGVALQAMRQPVLALNGELDRQVPSQLDLDAVRAALASSLSDLTSPRLTAACKGDVSA